MYVQFSVSHAHVLLFLKKKNPTKDEKFFNNHERYAARIDWTTARVYVCGKTLVFSFLKNLRKNSMAVLQHCTFMQTNGTLQVQHYLTEVGGLETV